MRAKVALGRHALADTLLDRAAQVALAGGERLGQRHQGAEGEHVVPGGDRAQRDPVGGHLDLRGGRPQPRAGGKDALGGGAEIEDRLVDGEQGVGALPRPRALDDVERVFGKFARDHPVGGDAEIDRRQPSLTGLLEHAHRLVLPRRRLGGAGMALDRRRDHRAERLEAALLATQPEDGIGSEIDGERAAGRRGQGILGERGRARRQAGQSHRHSPRFAHLPPFEPTSGAM